MTFNQLIKDAIERHKKLVASFDNNQIKQIDELIALCLKTLQNSKTIFFAGNGGSFSDAQHIVAELVVRYKKERQAYKSICLGTNSSNLTACGNDYDFDSIFSRELDALGQNGDLLVVISTSGNSKNILKLLDTAKQKNIETFALLGKSGGEAIKSTKAIVIGCEETARIQEMHILIGHILCEAIDCESE